VDAVRHSQLIQRYRDGVKAVVVAVDGLSDEELDRRPAHVGWSARELIRHLADIARPASRDWSPRQVIHNLADAETIEAVRLRRMLVENTPVLQHWDEDRYAQRLHYDRPIASALESFEATAELNAELLESLSDQEWKREGNQERPWPLSVETWLEEKVDHIHKRLMEILNAAGSPGATSSESR
jgi:hypothetical protein